MKNLLFLLIIPICMVGCKKNEDTGVTIQGKWKLTSSTYDYYDESGAKSFTETFEPEDKAPYYITFSENQAVISTTYFNYPNYQTDEIISGYVLTGNKLSFENYEEVLDSDVNMDVYVVYTSKIMTWTVADLNPRDTYNVNGVEKKPSKIVMTAKFSRQ
ncbi:hypothetical protein BCY91_13970 [Pelobium manganitolerans]|uniref:Lipocalin-like domain-containing protein n=1 Tax=Pelobium manganitolerans TaxID=1842495 RepID=A0A419S9S4_9SPHI|nr:hypothetical protein [Pelobium manganitolerans]RKD18979.1 hypothetical protein BCY91_13970 [Pelobium manganitolerans]